jgi:cell division protease FtsH
MVTRYGMSAQLGNLTYGIPREARYLKSPFASEEKNYSEQTAEQIDVEVRRIIDRQYDRVKSILSRRRKELNLIANTLLTKETLEREELETLLSEPQPAPVTPA